MKDAQAILRHKHIKTTAEVYMDQIPENVRKAIDARTEAIFKRRRKGKQHGKSRRVLLTIADKGGGERTVTDSKEWLLR
jgi:hypothetical protein